MWCKMWISTNIVGWCVDLLGFGLLLCIFINGWLILGNLYLLVILRFSLVLKVFVVASFVSFVDHDLVLRKLWA